MPKYRKLRGIIALVGTFATYGAAAEGQQTKKVPRIGFVSVSGDPKSPGRNIEAFRQGFRDLGYDEGKNVVVEYRYTTMQPDRVPELVAELMQLKIDVLVSSTASAIRAAQQASKQIPIVMVTAQDPVRQGLSTAWLAQVGISPAWPDLWEI